MLVWMSHISSGREERERKQGLPVERHAGRAGCREAGREQVSGWSVASARGGRWGGEVQEVVESEGNPVDRQIKVKKQLR